MRRHRVPRWSVPIAVLAVDAVLLFGAVGVGLSISAHRFLGGFASGAGLDYSVLVANLPPLSDAFLADTLGIPVRPRMSPRGANPSAPAAGPAELASGSPEAHPSEAHLSEKNQVIDPHALTNDNLADARAVEMGSGGYHAEGTTRGAGREPGEPRASCDPAGGGGTIWYRYDAAETSPLVATTRDARYWVVLAAYLHLATGQLQEIACNEDPQGNTQIKLTAEAGRTYFLQIAAPVENGPLEMSVTRPHPGVTYRGSIASGGGQGNDFSALPSVSRTGRFVAFTSGASNLVPGDGNACAWLLGIGAHRGNHAHHVAKRSCPDVFLHDRLLNTTTLVSRGIDGPADGASWSPDVSSDGRWVAFTSMATNLVASPRSPCLPLDPTTRSCSNVYLWDRTTGSVELVSVSSAGEAVVGNSDWGSISDDGRLIAFHSDARNLAPGNEDGIWRVFVRDRLLGTTRVISFPFDGVSMGEGGSRPEISADGRHVVFEGGAERTLPSYGYNHWQGDVFAHDLSTGETRKLSVAHGGGPADGNSLLGSISASGRYVAFWSTASDLLPSEPPPPGTRESASPQCWQDARTVFGVCGDIYVRDRDADGDGVLDEPGATTMVRVSVATSGSQPAGTLFGSSGSWQPSISSDGRYVSFMSWANLDQEYEATTFQRVFRHDRDADGDGVFDEPGAVETRAVAVSSSGEPANGESIEGEISGDGRSVVFHSVASNLAEGDTNGVGDVFVHTFEDVIDQEDQADRDRRRSRARHGRGRERGRGARV